MLKPYQDRVVTEKQELDTKIQALSSFLVGEGTRNLSIDDISLLSAQLYVMREYSSILANRISRF